eukprot:1678554-Rhodomonas_salina.2
MSSTDSTAATSALRTRYAMSGVRCLEADEAEQLALKEREEVLSSYAMFGTGVGCSAMRCPAEEAERMAVQEVLEAEEAEEAFDKERDGGLPCVLYAVCCYAFAIECLALGSSMLLRICYAVSGTEMRYAATRLRKRQSCFRRLVVYAHTRVDYAPTHVDYDPSMSTMLLHRAILKDKALAEAARLRVPQPYYPRLLLCAVLHRLCCCCGSHGWYTIDYAAVVSRMEHAMFGTTCLSCWLAPHCYAMPVLT